MKEESNVGSMPRIYTKTGDDGSTGQLFGGRVGKDSLKVAACGDIDEAVAVLGLARAQCVDFAGMRMAIQRIQRDLFVVGADIMTNKRARDKQQPGVSRVTVEMVEAIERLIDDSVAEKPLRPIFIVPGANQLSATLDIARAVVRRAERHSIRISREEVVSREVLRYLNRASDLIYVLARHAAGSSEELPSHE